VHECYRLLYALNYVVFITDTLYSNRQCTCVVAFLSVTANCMYVYRII